MKEDSVGEMHRAIEIIRSLVVGLPSEPATLTLAPAESGTVTASQNVYRYYLTVEVGDSEATGMGFGGIIHGDDVSRLEYTVSYHPDADRRSTMLGPDSADIEHGERIFQAILGTELQGYTMPRQTFGGGVPAADISNYFILNEEKTAEQLARGHKAKVFSINFMPDHGPGWYRLRFNATVNRAIGVIGDEWSDDDTLHIGSVKLTIRQLEQMRIWLRENNADKTQAGDIEAYIDALLVPGGYQQLAENHGYVSIDLRVPSSGTSVRPRPKK